MFSDNKIEFGNLNQEEHTGGSVTASIRTRRGDETCIPELPEPTDDIEPLKNKERSTPEAANEKDIFLSLGVQGAHISSGDPAADFAAYRQSRVSDCAHPSMTTLFFQLELRF